jgi:hypothetical protein
MFWILDRTVPAAPRRRALDVSDLLYVSVTGVLVYILLNQPTWLL